MQKNISQMTENNIYRIIRSPRRKRIIFRIAADGILEVAVPQLLPENLISKLVADNQELIRQLRQKVNIRPFPEFDEGNHFMLLGVPYPLHLTHRLRIFDNGFMIPRGSHDEMKNAMISLYRELASSIIRKRIIPLQTAAGCAPDKIRITGADTRWGSCSSSRTIAFSWKLIQCPPETVDYVIAHELSHLKEMNHSPAFWRHVASIIPDYRKKKRQLNEFALQLPQWD